MFCTKPDVGIALRLFCRFLVIDGDWLRVQLVFFIVVLNRAALALVVELALHSVR